MKLQRIDRHELLNASLAGRITRLYPGPLFGDRFAGWEGQPAPVIMNSDKRTVLLVGCNDTDQCGWLRLHEANDHPSVEPEDRSKVRELARFHLGRHSFSGHTQTLVRCILDLESNELVCLVSRSAVEGDFVLTYPESDPLAKMPITLLSRPQ